MAIDFKSEKIKEATRKLDGRDKLNSIKKDTKEQVDQTTKESTLEIRRRREEKLREFYDGLNVPDTIEFLGNTEYTGKKSGIFSFGKSRGDEPSDEKITSIKDLMSSKQFGKAGQTLQLLIIDYPASTRLHALRASIRIKSMSPITSSKGKLQNYEESLKEITIAIINDSLCINNLSIFANIYYELLSAQKKFINNQVSDYEMTDGLKKKQEQINQLLISAKYIKVIVKSIKNAVKKPNYKNLKNYFLRKISDKEIKDGFQDNKKAEKFLIKSYLTITFKTPILRKLFDKIKKSMPEGRDKSIFLTGFTLDEFTKKVQEDPLGTLKILPSMYDSCKGVIEKHISKNISISTNDEIKILFKLALLVIILENTSPQKTEYEIKIRFAHLCISRVIESGKQQDSSEKYMTKIIDLAARQKIEFHQ